MGSLYQIIINLSKFMTKTNLWQIIVGMVVTAICGVILNMGVFSFFPALIVAIAWAGYKQTSGKEYKDKNGNYTEPKFWKDFVPVMAGALVMWLISIL